MLQQAHIYISPSKNKFKAQKFKWGAYFIFSRPQKSETPWEKLKNSVKRILFMGFLPNKFS